MKELFREVPSVEDSREQMSDEMKAVAEGFARRIVKALEKAPDLSCTLQASSEESMLFRGYRRTKIESALREKGWSIELISDQRDGDYFSIKPKGGSMYDQ